MKFRYEVIDDINFKYNNDNIVRNTYGRKGKS